MDLTRVDSWRYDSEKGWIKPNVLAELNNKKKKKRGRKAKQRHEDEGEDGQ